jgi:protein SCO1
MVRLGFLVLLFSLLAPHGRAADYPLFRPIDPPLPVGSFTLTERHGEKFGPEKLRGKVWVAHFFFTSCPGPCVKTMPGMQKLQQTFAGKPDVALVSITVNSEFDTPEVLQDYAKAKGAEPGQWFFLTGAEAEVHDVVKKCFFKGVERTGKDVTHSPDLVLVDRDGNIRGYVDGQDPAAISALSHEIRTLAAHKYLLPSFNATLNALCAWLLIVGYVAIRRRRETLHIACMVSALIVSAVFLTGYLYFHFAIQGGQPTLFRGTGLVRAVYFSILVSHTILAIAVAPLAIFIAYLGFRDKRPRHVRLARWVLPMWLYVSVTGVVVYEMLYQLYPPY